MTRKVGALFACLVGCGGKIEASPPPEAGVDAAAVIDDAGAACVPFDGASPPPYTSGSTGCFGNGTMTINSDPVCAADEYSVSCVGNLPQTPIPSPPDSGECTIVPIPTPQNVLFWCCHCAF